MKTAKETAKDFIYKFESSVKEWDCYYDVPLKIEDKIEDMKECANILVSEIISLNISFNGREIENNFKMIDYYIAVQKEILSYEIE
jgi:hypothetical protein